MKARRKIIVYIATSADGYIARPDGDVEWLNRRPRKVDYGMRTFYPTIDTPPKQAALGVEFVSEPVKAFAQRLRGMPGKHIWMMGGGELIASFLDAGEIDEFDIHVIPTFIGKGIPLVAPRHRDVPLRLRLARKYPDGGVRLRYEVAR